MKNKEHKKINIFRFLCRMFWFTLYTLHFTLYTAFAAPHISGKHIPGQPKDHVHKIPDVRQLRAIGLSPQAIREAIGAVGTKKVAVILVNFNGLGSETISKSSEISKFSDIQYYISELKKFYKEVSYNNLTLEFDFYPSSTSAYSLTQKMSYYGYKSKNTERGDVLIQEAITKNSNIRHTNSGGIYDAVMVIHAGYGNEAVSSSNTGDIWSAVYEFSDTQGFTEGSTVPETAPNGKSPFGVYCHEFGHQLGLPDLYNTDTGTTQVGKWCLMDMGTWAGNGSQPSHPSIWCKDLLGWIEPVSITSSVINCSLSAIEISSQAIKIPIETGSGAEYFLLEYRRKSEPSANYDKGLPGEGILIWHIDDTIGSVTNNDINNYTTRRVDLEEADSSDPSEDNGDSTDPWPGTKITFESPQSNANNTTLSGVTVTDFTGAGESAMSFNILKTKLSPEVTVAKTYNFPNPFPIPTQTKTTIKFTLTRPTTKIEVKIYTLSGELVYTIPYEKIEIVDAKDYEYVYKTDPWEGINQEGEKLASGIYFYVIKADKEVKVGKLAIIR